VTDAPVPLSTAGLTPAARWRWPRSAAYGVAGFVLLAPTSTAAAAWYFATQVIDASRPREHPLTVRSVLGNEVTLTRTVDTDRNVPLALHWSAGHAQLGGVVSRERDSVVRLVDAVSRGELRPGVRAYVSSAIFDGDPRAARGLPYAEVAVAGELGDLPAWRVPPTGEPHGTWVVAVHGRGATRAEALRTLPTLAALGYTTLVATYRNDEGAPRSPDRYYHLGHGEARDVRAAVRYALDNGATDVVLYGWSMGGAAVLTALRELEPGVVSAVVLDCPVTDWVATLRMQARQRRLPTALTWSALRVIEQRVGVRLSTLDQVRHAARLDAPTLVFLDGDDTVVDPRSTRALARVRPDLVTLVETAGGGHTRSWNRDPHRYEGALRSFLAR
jgi:uncharacterized protein